MTREDKIKAALAALDHDNDDHWTSAGKAKMSVIKQLSALDDLTRDDVDAVVPDGFERHTNDQVKGDVDAPHAVAPPPDDAPGSVDAGGATTADGDPSIAQSQNTDASTDQAATTDAEAPANDAEAMKAELQRRIADCVALRQEKTEMINQLNREIREIDAAHTALGYQYQRLFPAPNAAEAVKAYHKRRQQIREAQADAGRERAGRSLVGQSQLDRAMARRRGFGLQRPEPQPLIK